MAKNILYNDIINGGAVESLIKIAAKDTATTPPTRAAIVAGLYFIATKKNSFL